MKMTDRLKPGKPAPPFEAWDISGTQPINLQRYRGRYVLLSFYRYASCPLCNLRVHELMQRHADWQARGLDMLAVFQSPVGKIRQYVGAQQTPFPLIPDPEQNAPSAWRRAPVHLYARSIVAPLDAARSAPCSG